MDFFQTSFSPQTSQLSEKDMLHLQLFSGQNSSPNQYASQNQFNCSPTQYVLPDIRESVTPPKMRFLKIKQEPDFDSGGFKSACVVEMPSDSDCDAQTTSSSSPFGEATRRIVQFAEDCAVCGDRATGFHYDVASCNGCKTFFRRTVVTGRKFVCQKNGKCLMELDKTKRCACRSCRFQRCVDVGMNPNAIQYTPSTNLTLSIARKKLKRQFSSYSSSSVTISPIVSVDSEILKRIGDVLHVELKHDRLRNSTFMPFRLNLSVEEILQKQSAFGEAERYQLVQKWPVKFVAPWKEEYAEMGMKFWFYQDLYLSVEYLKTFSWFNELSTQDQTVLAKEVCMAGTALSASYQSFLKGADRVVYPDGHVPFTTLDHFRVDLEAILQKSVVQPVTKLKLDSVQYVLMKAMVFLNGDADGLSNEARDMIHEERSKYSKTLLKYLQNRLGGSEGMKQFSAICQTMIEIVRYTQNHRNYFTLRRFNFFNADDTLPPPSRLLEQTVGLLP